MENEIKLKQLLISILRHGGNYVRNYPTVAIENALQEQGLRFTGNDIEPYNEEEELKDIDVDVNSIIQECQVNNDDTSENLHSYLYGDEETETHKGLASNDYLEENTKEWPNGISYVEEDDAYEAVDMAKREIAWEVHKMICAGATISEIDKWVTDICDF